MQINSIIDIVDGDLLNSPSISFIYNIKTNPKKVIEGDLFIAKTEEEISVAIQKGAFAVIYDFNTQIIDNEIAWIKVVSVNDALIKLFRFKLSSINLKAYYCDDITYKLIDLYRPINSNIKLLSQDLAKSIKIIENISEEDVLFCPDKGLINKLYPNSLNFNNDTYEVNNLIEHSLFETSFSYKENYFSKLKISSLYINQFLDVYTLFNATIDYNKLRKLNNFKPIFVDKFLSIVDFGKSDKFILVQENKELIDNEIKFINQRYKYAKSIYITNESMDGLNEEHIVLNNIKTLKESLKDKVFNCVYIIGYRFEEVEYVLSQSNHNQLLF